MKARWIVLLVIVVAVILVVTAPLWPIFGAAGNDDWTFHNPYETDGQWYKGQLHCHSTVSDGDLAPGEVASRYLDLGFDFIAITDHYEVARTSGGSLLVLGEEFSKGSTESGGVLKPHMNGLNISSVPPNGDSFQSRIEDMRSQGGIVILNHPDSLFFAYSRKTLQSLTNYTGIELYNARAGGVITGTWDSLLSNGKMVWGFATDDAHDDGGMGKAWIEVRLSGALTTSNVINAIKQGSFYSSQGPAINDISFEGGVLRVNSSEADSVSFYGKGGRLLKTVSGGEAELSTEGAVGYVRVEVSKDGLRAWSQPIFLGSDSEPDRALSIEPVELEILAATLVARKDR